MSTSPKILSYCNNLFNYSRRLSSQVNIGNTPIGGKNPIRIQSMTNTNTMDTKATVEQSIRMIESGARYIRITAQGRKEAENLKFIKEELVKRGFNTPLVADIHFNPVAAEIAARYVDKVRINPGNFVDKRAVFEKISYSKEEYQQELNRIRQKFIPLINICKSHNTALRIGTNHGSLSDRIMSRYGDTPKGMVESTMEFLRICKEENFPNVVISIKSSNTAILVKTIRLLILEMNKEDMHYPLHLGVTEAGEGEDGRIKSAVGTGALLNDGIGDTIRISLTENPEVESPVGQKLIDYVLQKENHPPIENIEVTNISLTDFYKRPTHLIKSIGSSKVPIVITDISYERYITTELPQKAGYILNSETLEWNKGKIVSDFIYIHGYGPILKEYPSDLGIIVDQECWKLANQYSENTYPLFTADEYRENNPAAFHTPIHFIKCQLSDLDREFINRIKSNNKAVLIAESEHQNSFAQQRAFAYKMVQMDCDTPIIFKRNFKEKQLEDLQLKAACDLGGLFLDGLGNGIWLDNKGLLPPEDVNSTAFGILQAAHVRTSKTEFVSCPGCGRTLFDLQETVTQIKQNLSHLTHLKIGIMGCIVNGPGEMGDVDYGYVGAGSGKITLYKGHKVIKKDIPTREAIESLIEIIKEHGDWISPDIPQ